MNSHQIQNVLNYLLPEQFGGVYPADKLPSNGSNNNKSRCFVANTHNHDEPGEHWVAFYFPLRGTSEYFDSYGLPPWKDYFDLFLGERYVMSAKPLQSLSSSACGQYCILFLTLRSRGLSMRSILQMFSSDTRQNDKIATDFYETIILPPQSFYHSQSNQKCKNRKDCIFQ